MDSAILWKIVHIDEINNRVVLCKFYEEIINIRFGPTRTDVKYSESNIIDACTEFESTLPSDVRNLLISITVHGVTKKVWIPQVNWISTDQPDSASGTNNEWVLFDYFNNDDNLSMEYSSAAINEWWTASAANTNRVYSVSNAGRIRSTYPEQYGSFRPFIALPLKY